MSVYDVPSTKSGSAYEGSASPVGTKKGGGNIFGNLLGDLEDAATGFGPALVALGRHPVRTAEQSAESFYGTWKPFVSGYYGLATGDIGRYKKNRVKFNALIHEDPLRALDILGPESFAAGRIAALRALPAEAGAGAATRAVLTGRTTGPLRTVTVRDTPTGAEIPVRTLPRRAGQARRMVYTDQTLKLITHEFERLTGKPWGSFPLVGEFARASREIERATRNVELKHLSDPRFETYQRAFAKLTKNQRVAFTAISKVPLPEDLQGWMRILSDDTGDAAQRTLAQLADSKVLDLYHGFANSKPLVRAHEAAADLVRYREEILARTGALSPEAAAAAVYAPTRVARGAEFTAATAPLVGVADELGATVRIIGKKATGKLVYLRDSPDGVNAEATVFYPRFGRSETVAISDLERVDKSKLVGGGTPEEIAREIASAGVPAYSASALHITTPGSASAIRRRGFNVQRGKGLGGDDYGPGIYLADEASDMGGFWRDQLETKNERGKIATETMRAKVALTKPFRYAYVRFNRVGDDIGRVTPREALEAQRPDLLNAYDKAAKTLTEKRALGKVLRDAGYDGLVVEHKAGDEIVAFDKGRVAFEGGKPADPLGGRPQPFYTPDVTAASRQTRAAFARTGGRTRPKSDVRGSQRILFRTGQLALHPDLLTPSFLRAVAFDAKIEKHEQVKAAASPIEEGHGLPADMEWVREISGEKIPHTLTSEGEHLAAVDKMFPENKPLTVKEGEEGGRIAVDAEGRRLAISRTLAKRLEVDVKQSNLAVKWLFQKPLDVWRALVLNLRIPWLVNNIVGNNLLYALRFAGVDGMKAYVGLLSEPAKRKLLKSSVTRRHLTPEDIAAIFPEQTRGTFIGTQTPNSLGAGKVRKAVRVAGAGLAPLDRRTEQAIRRAAVETVLRGSPEVKALYKAMPKETRTLRAAMTKAAADNPDLRRLANTEANRALGDYLSLNDFERGALRRVAPFYGWYREIARIAAHAVVDTPVRVALLANLATLEEDRQRDLRGDFPTFLEGSIALGPGAGGTERVLALRSANPFSTVADELRIASLIGDYNNRAGANALVGTLNPYGAALASSVFRSSQGDPNDPAYLGATAAQLSRAGLPGLIAAQVVGGLPQTQALTPPPPSKLYPTRDRNAIILRLLGDIRRDPNLGQAHLYASQGR